jgi:hypothetical protein
MKWFGATRFGVPASAGKTIATPTRFKDFLPRPLEEGSESRLEPARLSTNPTARGPSTAHRLKPGLQTFRLRGYPALKGPNRNENHHGQTE